MVVCQVTVIDDVLEDAESYVNTVILGDFVDFTDGANTFKNILPRGDDEVKFIVENLLPYYKVQYNFIRKSPEGQQEPNFVHHDGMMGDMTAILYLNKEHPANEGTSLYENESTGSLYAVDNDFTGRYKKAIDIRMKFNRMVIFPSNAYHARNVEENFGEGESARLIQVLFLKKKI